MRVCGRERKIRGEKGRNGRAGESGGRQGRGRAKERVEHDIYHCHEEIWLSDWGCASQRTQRVEVLCRVVVHHVGVRVLRGRECVMCAEAREERGWFKRDRDGSTAPGSLELLMRSPPPLVFLDSVSLLLSFSPFLPLNYSTLFLLLGFHTLLTLSLCFRKLAIQ